MYNHYVGECIDIFYRCDNKITLPTINTTQPHCPLTNEELKRFEEFDQCNILPKFTAEVIISYDYFEDVTIEGSSLVHTALYCYQNITNSLCNDHNLCLSCKEITQASIVYTLEACRMKFFASEFFWIDSKLNYELFYKMALTEAMFTEIEYDWEELQNESISTIQHGGYSQAFFHTCSSSLELESCINIFLKQCFEFKGPGWIYYCQELVYNRICSQFRGNDLYKCIIKLEEKLYGDYEETCSEYQNEGTCVSAKIYN